MTGRGSVLDFAAFERKDLDCRLSFYTDDTGWIESRHSSPPRSPNSMIGKRQIVVEGWDQ